MQLDQVCCRDVATVAPEASVLEAARLMRTKRADVVVVVDGARRPLGVLTDREVATIGVAAEFQDLHHLSVRSVMALEPLVVPWNTRLATARMRMRRGGLHRLLVVDLRGALVGIVTLDATSFAASKRP